MFGRSAKPVETEQAEAVKTPVYTIPKEFYGGANPVINFRNVERVANLGPAPQAAVAQGEVKNKPVTPIAPKPNTPAGLFENKKMLALLSVLLFLVFAAGAGVYYWRQMNPPAKPTPKTTENPPVQVPVIVPPVPTSTEVAPVTTTVNPEPEVPTSTVSMNGGVLEFPSILLGTSADSDNDGLSDSEEELFGTDLGKPDTDGDGYEDGLEITNLYSPYVIAPMRLISTDSAKEFMNPYFNYRVYYPASWAVGNVDDKYRDMLFSTITGENIEIRVFDKTPGQTFDDWFSEWAKGEQLGALKDITTVFKGQGRVRNDGLVYYFQDENRVYVMVYHVTGGNTVNYRRVIEMMAQSFRRPQEVDAVLPEQKVIREDPAAAQ